MDKNKIITTENLALTLYANASVGFYDAQFVHNAFEQFSLHDQIPDIQTIGYFAQSLALLRRNEYTNKIAYWLERLVLDKTKQFIEKSGYNIANEFSFVQVL